MVTVFTPAYNRAHVLDRAYNSLKSQTYKDFEWVIIDDGSSDNTKEVVDFFIAQDNFFEIRYYYQENQGKHNATNSAVQKAKGDLFITLDSDDGCKPTAIERLVAMWNTIPDDEKKNYKGVSCRCCNPKTPDTIIGTHLSQPYIDSNDHDLRFKLKVKGELWGMTRREVLLENPYPAIKGLHYFPEGVYWGKIGLKYKTRYFDEPLRYYYIDGDAKDNQLTKRANPKETYYAREYMLSPRMLNTYFKDDPLNFLLQAIGFVRDGLLTKRPVKELFAKANQTKIGGLLFIAAFLPGKLLQIKEKRNLKR